MTVSLILLIMDSYAYHIISFRLKKQHAIIKYKHKLENQNCFQLTNGWTFFCLHRNIGNNSNKAFAIETLSNEEISLPKRSIINSAA